jgi:hypothetical protein
VEVLYPPIPQDKIFNSTGNVRSNLSPDRIFLLCISVYFNVGWIWLFHERTQTENLVIFEKGRQSGSMNPQIYDCDHVQKKGSPGSSVQPFETQAHSGLFGGESK